MTTKHLRKQDFAVVVAARRKHRAEREHAATRLRQSLAAAYRRAHGLPEDAEIDAPDDELLKAAVSAATEISITTSRLIQGHAHQKALKNLGLARSELRRALRALGLVANDGESSAAPTGPTIEDLKKEYAEREAVGVAK